MAFIQIAFVVYHTDWLEEIEKFLHPWDKFHLIMVYDPFNVLLDLVFLVFYWGFGFPSILLRFICVCVCMFIIDIVL